MADAIAAQGRARCQDRVDHWTAQVAEATARGNRHSADLAQREVDHWTLRMHDWDHYEAHHDEQTDLHARATALAVAGDRDGALALLNEAHDKAQAYRALTLRSYPPLSRGADR